MLGAALRQISHLFGDGVVTGLSDAQLLERFANGHDAAAFEVLVARHGPMVLSVCRGVLRDPNDAEDAFQATFLILVKKSGAIRGRVALGPWLYRVAYRVGLRANTAAARRRDYERRAGQMAAASSVTGSGTDETLQTLHEEIARLPEKLRRAVILCDLQRLPRARAADELRLSESTLQRRLNAGRERLKARLIRRGLAHESGMLGAVFLREAQSPVPAAWCQATVRAAMATTANHAMAAGAVSAAAKRLSQEVLRTMLLRKLTLATATLLAAGLVAWGTSAALVPPGEEPPQKAAATAKPKPNRSSRPEAVALEGQPPDPIPSVRTDSAVIRGRVLGPDGQPVPGARLYVTPATGYLMKPFPSSESATTGADGRFAFTPPEPRHPGQTSRVSAAAPGYGPGWVNVAPDDARDDLTIRLVPDTVPITGQIIDLEGKPVAGASVRVLQINAAPAAPEGEGLDRWLDVAKAGKGLSLPLEHEFLGRETIAPSWAVITDAEGRFRLDGIGRDRLVLAQLDGPTLVSEYLHILTRPTEPVVVTESEARRGDEPRVVTTYYGAAFQHAAAPCKPIVGVVRDRDTQKPLAGVLVRSYALASRPNFLRDIVRTTTDSEGRYRLPGMPKGTGNRIVAVPGSDLPYLVRTVNVPNSAGLAPVTVDIELKRGVWIEGKITDKVTGQPVRGTVEYFALSGNPNLDDYPGFTGSISFEHVLAKKDGSYRVAGLPGPGLVAVYRVGRYLESRERDDEYGTRSDSLRTDPYIISFTSNYSALARIDPPQGVDSVRRDVTLDPGWTITGVVLGPDGAPLAGAFGMGVGQLKTAEFTMSGLNPRRTRDLLFRHPARGLIALAPPPKANGESITLRLQPGATVTGRLVDADGHPQPDRALEMRFHPKEKEETSRAGRTSYGCHEPIRTDREGRFRIEALPPGYEFELHGGKGGDRLVTGDNLHQGQTHDLGDVRLLPAKAPDG